MNTEVIETALAVAPGSAITAPMPMSPAEMIGRLQAYQKLQKALDESMPDQIMNLDGKPFRKKGYWRAIRLAFGLTVEPVTPETSERSVVGLLEDGTENYVYSVTYRAVAPNGQYATGDGTCAAAEKQKGKMRATEHNVRSHSHCVPLRAEILTRRGFRRYDEVLEGEEVLSYDCDRDVCVWTPLRSVSVFEQQPLVTLSSKSFLASCTPEHSWAVKRERTREKVPYQSMVKTNEFSSYWATHQNAIVLAAPAVGGEHELSASDAAILGWIITDGSIRRPNGENSSFYRVHIDQSKEEYVDELRELVGACARETVAPSGQRTFPTGNTSPTRPSHRFDLRSAKVQQLFRSAQMESREDLPGLVTRLSVPARGAMLDAMLKADGHQRWSRTNEDTWVFANKDPHVFEAFQLLATLEGRALGRYVVEGPRQSRVNNLSLQAVRSTRHAQLRALVVEGADYDDVWCPTTDYGTWVMRLDGNVMITGNTRAFNRAVSNLVGFGEVSAEEIEHGSSDAAEPSKPVSVDGVTRVVSVEKRTGTSKAGKPYTSHTVTLEDGRSGSTFDEALAKAAEELRKSKALCKPEFETKGKYQNLVGFATPPEPALPIVDTEPVGQPEKILTIRAVQPEKGANYWIVGTDKRTYVTPSAEFAQKVEAAKLAGKRAVFAFHVIQGAKGAHNQIVEFTPEGASEAPAVVEPPPGEPVGETEIQW